MSEYIENHDDEVKQYGLLKIMLIWLAVTLPMPILVHYVAPLIAKDSDLSILIIIWMLLIGGMIWQFVLSVGILIFELKDFSWLAIRKRIWLQKPRNPKTNKPSLKLFWWLIPAFLLYIVVDESGAAEYIGELILIPFPFLADLPVLNLVDLTEDKQYVGAWWLMGVAVISNIFNYFLGEELLFRGILLPKMKGVFGRWDFVANTVLFSLYHLHRPTQMLGFIFTDILWAYTSSRFKSMWFGVILHGFEGIILLGAMYWFVSGNMFE